MSTPIHDGAEANSSIESLFMQIVHLLPKNSVSQAMGQLSEVEIPVALRPLIYGTYAQQFGANVDEAEKELSAYPTLNAFFTRSLKAGVRPVDRAPDAVVSPVDGTVSEFGPIVDNKLTQTKGRLYDLVDLVGSKRDAEPFVGGSWVTIYLHPRDYHRIHCHVDADIVGFRYEPGHLFPVNGPSVRSIDELFCVNERVTVFLDAHSEGRPSGAEYGGSPSALVMVGATCVGRMTLAFDDLVTNQGDDLVRRVRYEDGKAVARAGELGAFNLGSTVILLFAKDAFEVDPGLHEGLKVRLGERIGTLRS